MKSLLFLTVFHIALFGLANNGNGDNSVAEINVTDEQGRKQGKWIFLGKDQPEKGYPNEGKISEGVYKDDRKNGKWTIYFKDGVTPKVIGEFKNNRPNGTFQKFYPNGKLREEGTFEGNRYVDSLKRYSINGNIVYQAKYTKSGHESGTVKYYYDNGNPEFVYNSENGTPIGKATRYWNNGDVKEELNFDEKGEVQESSGIIEPVNPLVKEEKSDIKTAPKVTKRKNSYTPNGYNTIYNNNKELWMEGEFKNDKLWDGRVLIYDKDGLLLKVEIYKEGVYHCDGQL